MKCVKLLLLLLCVSLSGCVSIKYNASKGKLSYFRMGKQSIDDLEFGKKGDSLDLKLKKITAEDDLNGVIGILQNILDTLKLKAIADEFNPPDA